MTTSDPLFVRGRLARSLEDGKGFVRDFIVWTRSPAGRRGSERQSDFDLFLPWLLECVSNERTDEADAPAMTDVDRLYMEVAAELSRDGILRPGPRKVTAPNVADGYGKGFSLTYRGDEWLSGA